MSNLINLFSLHPLQPIGHADIDLMWLYLPAFEHVEVETLMLALDPDEIKRFHRYKSETAAQTFLVCRAFLKHILASRTGRNLTEIQLKLDVNGKPHLAGHRQSLHFNVSHSHEFALIALTESGELGVDIERIDSTRSWRDLAKRFFSSVENKAVTQPSSADEQLIRFYRGWTRKEALLKASGNGITVDLKGFDISLEAQARLLASRLPQLNPDEWLFPSILPVEALFASEERWLEKVKNYTYSLVVRQSVAQSSEKKLNNYIIHPKL